MRVVVFGERLRETYYDQYLINDIIDKLKEKYKESLHIYSAACDRGPGKYIKNRCMPKEDNVRYGEIDFTEIVLWSCVRFPSKERVLFDFCARNATLLEIGEEFHILLRYDRYSAGPAYNLLKRVMQAHLPVSVYLREGAEKEYKIPQVNPSLPFAITD